MFLRSYTLIIVKDILIFIKLIKVFLEKKDEMGN
jgi:hypothetical protein